jgi:flagellin
MAINAISGLTLNFGNSVEGAEKASAKDMLRLSTGLRINSAADDAAGLAISTRMNAQSRGMAMAIRNANDLLSLTQTAEGAVKDINDTLQHMRELSVQAANGTLTDVERKNINEEVTQLKQQIDAISKQTKFNNINLLDGSIKNARFQIGGNAQDTFKLSMPALDTSSLAQTPISNKYKLTLTALVAGQSVTVAGLTFKATSDTSAGDVVAAFSNLAENATTGTGIATGEYSGTFTGFSSGKADSAALELTTSASNIKGDVPKVAVTQLPVVPTINTYNVSFSSLVAGQSVTIAGLTFKANGDTTANAIAAAFMAGSSNSGTFTGSLQGFNASSTPNGQLSLISTPSNPQGVTPSISAQAGAAPQVPHVAITQGVQAVAAVAGTTAQTTVRIKNLIAGDVVSLGGLTFTCTTNFSDNYNFSTTTDFDLTNTFAGWNQGQTDYWWTNNLNSPYAGYFPQRRGTFSGSFQDWTWGGGTGHGNGYFTATYLSATPNASVASQLSFSSNNPSAVTFVSFQDGNAPVAAVLPITESANVQFTSITHGQSITVAGLKFTANQDLTASQVAVAFENLQNGATHGSASYGNYSGAYNGYTSVAATNGSVTMTSSTLNAPVADIVVTTGATSSPMAPSVSLTDSTSPLPASAPIVDKEASTTHEIPNSLSAITVTTEQGASDAIQVIDISIEAVSKFQAELGSVENRIYSVINNLTTANTNLKASVSRIDDADYAVETSNMARHQIISQAAMAMLAQANQSTGAVESLLKQFK